MTILDIICRCLVEIRTTIDETTIVRVAHENVMHQTNRGRVVDVRSHMVDAVFINLVVAAIVMNAAPSNSPISGQKEVILRGHIGASKELCVEVKIRVVTPLPIKHEMRYINFKKQDFKINSRN